MRNEAKTKGKKLIKNKQKRENKNVKMMKRNKNVENSDEKL